MRLTYPIYGYKVLGWASYAALLCLFDWYFLISFFDILFRYSFQVFLLDVF